MANSFAEHSQDSRMRRTVKDPFWPGPSAEKQACSKSDASAVPFVIIPSANQIATPPSVSLVVLVD